MTECPVCKHHNIVTVHCDPIFPHPNRYYTMCQDCKARTIPFFSAIEAEKAFVLESVSIEPGKCPRCDYDTAQVETAGGKLDEYLMVHCLHCGYRIGQDRKATAMQLVAQWNIAHDRKWHIT